jgi:hypothetical protein
MLLALQIYYLLILNPLHALYSTQPPLLWAAFRVPIMTIGVFMLAAEGAQVLLWLMAAVPIWLLEEILTHGRAHH